MKPSNPLEILPGLPRGAEVLVLRLRSLGDVVMLTPALAAVNAWRPDLRLSVMVEPPFAPVLEGNPAVAEILLFQSFFSAARELRRHHFPAVFNHHAGPTSAFLTAASGAPVRVCWAGCQFAFFYSALAAPTSAWFGERKVHTVEHRMTQFYFAGLPRDPIPRAQVFPQPGAVASVAQKLHQRGIAEGKPYAVIHPGASHFTKRWSLDGFAEIARWLQEKHGIAPVIRLGPGDYEIAAAARQHFGPSTVVFDAHAMDLREAIALIAGARLFLGNDSGPAHLATAIRRPSVVVFGPTDAETWRPWQTEHRVVAAAALCNPCRHQPCYATGGTRCILSVAVEQVRSACAEMLMAENRK